jgi:hypothetical protein
MMVVSQHEIARFFHEIFRLNQGRALASQAVCFPFSAIVGHEQMKKEATGARWGRNTDPV